MAVFRGAAAAVACAVGLQQRDRAPQPRRRRAAPRPGRRRARRRHAARAATASGMPVVEAVRLCGHADGGQILATDLVRVVGGRDGHPLPGAGRPRAARPAPAGAGLRGRLGAGPGAERSPAAPGPAARAPADGLRRPRRGGRAGPGALGAGPARGRARPSSSPASPGSARRASPSTPRCELHAEGAIVLAGHAAEGLGVPYGPWIEALGPLVEHAPEATLAAHVERHGGELARLVPALARRVPGRRRRRGRDPETERWLLFTAVAGLLELAGEEATRRPRARRPALGRRADARPPAPRRHRGAGRAAAAAGHLPRHGPRARPPAHGAAGRPAPRARDRAAGPARPGRRRRGVDHGRGGRAPDERARPRAGPRDHGRDRREPLLRRRDPAPPGGVRRARPRRRRPLGARRTASRSSACPRASARSCTAASSAWASTRAASCPAPRSSAASSTSTSSSASCARTTTSSSTSSTRPWRPPSCRSAPTGRARSASASRTTSSTTRSTTRSAPAAAPACTGGWPRRSRTSAATTPAARVAELARHWTAATAPVEPGKAHRLQPARRASARWPSSRPTRRRAGSPRRSS